MRPESKELADRIDIMIAFQNSEPVQWRSGPGDVWVDATEQGLAFHFESMEYRLKPVLKEGWVHPEQLHINQTGCGAAPCIHVRQVIEGEDS